MKTILFIIFFITTIISFSQTINDLLYVKINKYRKENGVNELTICDKAKIANTQQLNYMVITSTVPIDHTQKIQTNFGKTFNSFDERIEFIYGLQYEYVGENLIGLEYEGTKNIMSEKIITLWKNSPGHNEVLLSDEPVCFYINSKISNKIIINGYEHLSNGFIYVVLTTFK
jgi:uncharacterized protein YkwD